MKRQLHLNLFIHSRGHHEASWRHPAASPLALTDIRYYQDLAQRAEAGLFDSIFLADQLALGERRGAGARAPGSSRSPCWRRWRSSTSRIGLIATGSTTYTEPFNLARQFASIDHISNGRVGWNIVTSWLATAARQFRRRGPGQPRRPLCPRRGVHARGQGAVGQLGRRRGDRRPRRRAVCAGRTASGRSTTAATSTRWPGR